jgi:hypothetical protein
MIASMAAGLAASFSRRRQRRRRRHAVVQLTWRMQAGGEGRRRILVSGLMLVLGGGTRLARSRSGEQGRGDPDRRVGRRRPDTPRPRAGGAGHGRAARGRAGRGGSRPPIAGGVGEHAARRGRPRPGGPPPQFPRPARLKRDGLGQGVQLGDVGVGAPGVERPQPPVDLAAVAAVGGGESRIPEMPS